MVEGGAKGPPTGPVGLNASDGVTVMTTPGGEIISTAGTCVVPLPFVVFVNVKRS